MASLTIARVDLEGIVAHARRGAPEEVCGVLVGRREGEVLVVERVVATRNAHAQPRVAYLVAPEDLLRVVLQAEDEWGLEVVGFYHSHPAGPPHPSRADAAQASWPRVAHLLVWGGEGVGCWTWGEDEGFVECPVVARQ